MKKLRHFLVTGVLALLLLPLAALSGANSWTGSGPFATGLGNRVVNALATSPDGQTVYAGTGSGTVLSYEIVPPSVTTSAASGTTATGSTLNGSVNAQGGSFTTLFRYGTVSGVYPGSVAATPSPVTGNSDTPISASLSALVPNTTYYFVAEANGGITVQGSELTVTTGKLAPTASTGTATSVTGTTATLIATVNAQNDSTSMSFEYGLTTGYGSTATASPATVATYADTAISAGVVGLAPNTTYHFRVVATNSAGTTRGTDQSFTTLVAAPTAATGSASSVTTTSATLNGTVNANNSSTAVTFEYGTTASLGTSVAATPSPLTGSASTSVSAALSGLLPNTPYYFKVSATNAGGTVSGSTLSFTTSWPAPVASAASAISSNGFNANWGAVSGATKYWLDVATDSGFGSMVGGYNNKDVGNATTAAVTGLVAGTPYFYRVRADNGTVTSASSNTISVTTGTSRIVTNTLDSGEGSLRQTIADANPGDTVTFAGGVAGTITLTAPLSITKDLTITGPGAAAVTVSGNSAVGIFQLPGASLFTLQNLTLSNGAAVGGAALVDSAGASTTISGCVFNGNSALGGGAILSSGTLVITDSTFSGNSASTLFGGAISASGGGTVAISNTLFSGNSAPAGGAIANGATSMTLTNVTLSGNTANTGGGAIYASGGSTLNALNATVANNSTPGNGGGILAASGALVNLKNTLVANNTATTSGPDIAGAVTSQGYNLFGSTSGATIGGDTTGNLTSGAPLLGALANNGGTTQTLALLSGSPAINAGTCTGAPAADQRGMARPQSSACDIGAYERGVPSALSATGGTPQTTPISTAFATALTARVVDSLGVALDGESVTFAGPGSGASIAAGGSVNSSAAGVASFSASANAVGGSYVVTASINLLSASFNLTNSTSSNANLSALVLSSGTLTPVFAPTTTSYTAAVANAVTSITVTPTVADSTASVKVNGVAVASGSASGAIALSVGANTITVLVTAQDASTKTYTVVVTRAPAPDTTPPTLSAVGVSGTTQTTTTLSATSNEAATGYWIVVARSATAPTSAQVTAGVAYAGVTVVAHGSDAMTAALAKTFAVGGLTAGTSYDLYVVAQDSSGNISTPPNQVQFATQSVVLSSNANLSALSLSSGTLAPVFAPATIRYTAAVANAVTSITVTPTLADSLASVKVNGVAVASGSASGAIALNVGTNTITVLVTAQDTSTKTYTVMVSRDSGPIDPPPGPLVPGLYPNVSGMVCLPHMLNVAGGDGPTLFAGTVAVLSNAIGTPMRYAGQSPTGAVVLTGPNGADLAYVPIAFQTGDQRGDGVFAQSVGQYHVVSNAVALTAAPTLVRLDHFTSVLPAGTSVCMTDTGILWAALGGTTYVVRPGVAVQRVETPGPANLALGEEGHYRFTDNLGNRQTLYPTFLEPYTLWSYLRMLDRSASMNVQLDGTVLAQVNGVAYTLVPDMALGGLAPEHADQSWWQEGPNRYRMRMQQRFNASQGFTVR